MRLPLDEACSVLPFRDDNARLLAELSHEIRTPLAAMLGYADLLLDQNVDAALAPDSREALGVIRANSRHLLDLVNSILDWSRLDAGAPLRRSLVDPVAIASEVVRLLGIRAGEVKLRVVVDSSTPRTIATDATSLRQILINIVGNALKFTSSGEVCVQLSSMPSANAPTAPGLRIDVCDTGIGMTPEQLTRLFRPFSQGHDEVRQSYGGTGLGLAISHRLCQMLDGQLSVESSVGQGSRFRVELPSGHLVNSIMEPSLAFGAPTYLLAGKRILLADDCQDTRRLHVRLLRIAGAQVTEACHGREAYYEAERASAEPFDIILLDLEMPVWDGLATARALRLQGYGGALIALTATDTPHQRDACRIAGFDDYAVKPIAAPSLIEMLGRALSLVGTSPSPIGLGNAVATDCLT